MTFEYVLVATLGCVIFEYVAKIPFLDKQLTRLPTMVRGSLAFLFGLAWPITLPLTLLLACVWALGKDIGSKRE